MKLTMRLISAPISKMWTRLLNSGALLSLSRDPQRIPKPHPARLKFQTISQRGRSRLLLASLGLLALNTALPCMATTWTVTSLADDGSSGTLRSVLNNAADGDTITFDVTGTISLKSGELVIAKNVTITGPGANHLLISGNNLSRILNVHGGTTANISGVTIIDGYAPPGCCQVGRGAGIANGGTLTLTDSIVTKNFASDSGGGIVTGGKLTLINSTVFENSAANHGGGIYNTGTVELNNSIVSGNSANSQGSGLWNDHGSMTLKESTVSNNSGEGIHNGRTLVLLDSTVSANSGAGISNPGGALTLTSSTITGNRHSGIVNHAGGDVTLINTTLSGNSADGAGGGINNNWGALTVISSTISGNSAGSGAGIYNNTSGTVRLKNTILSNAGGNCVSYGAANSYGHNLSNDSSCDFLHGPGDLNSTPAGLVPGLQDNGGPTRTIALQESSAAIDAVPVGQCTDLAGKPLTVDQRGIDRPQGSDCDIGAFELEAPADSDRPVIQCGVPDGQWHASDVSISCTTSDSGSGLADPADASFALTTSVTAGSEDANAPTNSRQVCDKAGNCATAGPIAGNKVDKKGPAITITSPSGNYLLGQAITAVYACSDGGSGVASCAGQVANGAAVATSAVGSNSFTVNASDAVGNALNATSTYNVRFAPMGTLCLGEPGHQILQPIDADGSSIFKKGSTIPAKFRVCDAAGNSVGAGVVRSFRLVQMIAGTVSQVVDEPVFSTTPDTVFRWDAAAQQWVFNLSSKNLSGNRTYVYQITLEDETTIDFRFGLK